MATMPFVARQARRLGPLLALALLLACAQAAADAPSTPTPAVAPVISTPFVAYAAATPPARLHDGPGGTPGLLVPRGAELSVEAVSVGADGQLWYRVSIAGGAGGWLPADALSLVDSRPEPTPTATALPPTPTPARAQATPGPRPLVVTGSGQGLFLRVEPGQGEVIAAYADGTAVVPLGAETRLDGRRWLKVRAPDDKEGWMAADYLSPAR